jgi:predicted transposase YbfD/YdcC
LNAVKNIITLDAMGCQQEIAKQLIDQKADYILALKVNHQVCRANWKLGATQ